MISHKLKVKTKHLKTSRNYCFNCISDFLLISIIKVTQITPLANNANPQSHYCRKSLQRQNQCSMKELISKNLKKRITPRFA